MTESKVLLKFRSPIDSQVLEVWINTKSHDDISLVNRGNNENIEILGIWKVSDLINEVKRLLNLSNNKRIRLIYQGKLLQPDHQYLSSFKLQNNTFFHVAINNNDTINSESNDLATSNTSNDQDIELHDMRPNNIGSIVSNVFEYSRAPITENDEDSPISISERRSREGTFQDYMFGFFLGYTLGIPMIFCLFEPNISRKQQRGILVGLFALIVLNPKSSSQVNQSDIMLPTHSPVIQVVNNDMPQSLNSTNV